MPPRFKAEHEAKKDALIFLVRDLVNGDYCGKPYAQYFFVLPKKNGCICHMEVLWPSDEKEHSCCSCEFAEANTAATDQRPWCPCLKSTDRIHNLEIFKSFATKSVNILL